MKELKETHATGMIEIGNLNLIMEKPLLNDDFGIQIAPDGRVWICVNGIALLRFKPAKKVLTFEPTPLPIDEGSWASKIISYRHSECAGCEWHPNVCEYCQNSLSEGNIDKVES